MFKNLTTLCTIFVLAVASQSESAAENVQVILNSGRVVKGLVDEQTDDHELWIYSASAQVVVKSHWRWDDIQAVIFQNQTMTPQDFRSLSATVSSRPVMPPLNFHRPASVLDVRTFDDEVASLQVAGRFANWDADPEVDGFVMHVRPVTKRGQLLPVNGSVNIQLRIVQLKTTQLPPTSHLATQWSRELRPEDFTPDGYIYRLQFRPLTNSIERSVFTRAEFIVRLSVPGEGVFEARIPAP